MEHSIIHNPEKRCFECHISGHRAFVEYKLQNSTIIITKTYVPKPLEGRGIASEMVQKVAEYGYENGYDIRATCSYAVAWLQRHPNLIANQH
ncbi:MAG: N-acetyltransferase [Marinifilaceae bacterium]|nr:N-acetyltransferase [Marinifilaceae bacterium]